MLVVLSDLHFEEEASNHISGDGSHPPIEFKRNLPATPYRLLVQQWADEAVRNNDRPETQEWSRRLLAVIDGEPVYTHYDEWYRTG